MMYNIASEGEGATAVPLVAGDMARATASHEAVLTLISKSTKDTITASSLRHDGVTSPQQLPAGTHRAHRR